MIYLGRGKFKLESGEPAMRSCWECNPAHEHLKTVNCLHICFECWKYWVFDRFLDSFKSDKEFDEYFENLGLKHNDSTTKIDKGYRVTCIEIKTKKKGGENEC